MAFDAVCVGAVPWLDYTVDIAEGADLDTDAAGSITLTWVDPEALGRDIVITMPKSGRMLWPGAAVDDDDQPTDWPGWKFDGTEWAEDDSDAWVLGPVVVRISLDGVEAEAVADYPPATTDCEATPAGVLSAGAGNSPSPDASDGNAGTGAAGATPPPTSTIGSVAPTTSAPPIAALALLVAVTAGAIAASRRAGSERRRDH